MELSDIKLNVNNDLVTSSLAVTTTTIKTKSFYKKHGDTWKFIFGVLCVCVFFENLVTSGVATVILSTIEKEFFLTSTQSGFFLSVFELAAFIASPIFGFLGNKLNKMKLISISLFLVTVGSYIIGCSIFLKSPDYLIENIDTLNSSNLNEPKNTLFCNTTNSTNTLSKGINSTSHELISLYKDSNECILIKQSSSTNYKIPNLQYLLYFGHLVIGFGSVALYTIGIAYIEEITKPDQSSYCQAIFYGLGSVGGGIGFLITGQFLKINARFYENMPHPTSASDPNWIGAWWLPYLIYGTICTFLSMFVFKYSKIKENKFTAKNEKVEPDKKLSSNTKTKKFGETLEEFIMHLKKVSVNTKLTLMILATATEGILLKGFLGFISKYFEYQFSLTASNSTLITGSIALISVITGTLLSAYLINKFQWESRQACYFCSVLYFLTSFLFWILLNHCPETSFNENTHGSLNHLFKCENCDCDNKYQPVCLNSQMYTKPLVYQSPCHAGCQTQNLSNQYYNCKCLNIGNASLTSSQLDNLRLSSEFCENSIKCVNSLVVNCLAAFLIVFLTSVTLIPQLKAILGCVEKEFQSFALGVRSAVVRMIGNFAGSILFGQAIDQACKFWQSNCYNQRSCKIYYNFKMSLYLASMGFVCRFMTSVFMFISCILFLRDKKRSRQTHDLGLKKSASTATTTTTISSSDLPCKNSSDDFIGKF